MNFRFGLAGIMAGTVACLALATPVEAQVSADALLEKLVAKGILRQDEAAELKSETATNNAKGTTFKLSGAIKSVEIYGDIRMRFEDRSAKIGPEGGIYAGDYDVANRWRYAVRLGVRGDLVDDFYYGLRMETGANERSTWNTFGNAGSGQSPYFGPFSKANNYSVFIGLAYLGWRPTSWLDISVGRVPQPLYTTPMVWDSDFTPEGAVEKIRFTTGSVDWLATFGQFVYQDATPANAEVVEGGNSAAILGDFSDQNAYMLTWQAGFTYHFDTNLSFKVAPVVYTYVGHGTENSGFYGPFIGQGVNGFTFGTNTTLGSSSLPGGSISSTTVGPNVTAAAYNDSYNQTGINNLDIVEFPMELNFKIDSLDAKAFGDYSINLEGDARAREAYAMGTTIASTIGYPNPFPHGVQLGQNQAMQFGLAVGNNLGLVYGTTSKKGTWEARAYWQHVEQYALDPNLLDSDFFEGRANMQGLYTAFAYSFTDAMIATVRYGAAARINNALGTGGFNGDLPLPNPVNRYQVLQLDMTMRF